MRTSTSQKPDSGQPNDAVLSPKADTGVELGKDTIVAIIEVEGLVKTYSGRNVVDGITFSVDEGEIFGIVGPNGAGKTTTVESIVGLRRPDSGHIDVLGLNPIEDRFELTELVGAQLQESRMQDKIRVDEAIAMYASFYRQPRDWHELLEVLGLGDKADARYKDLSGGQKQRLSVALALVGSPRIAVLDELTTGLDPQARRTTWDIIEQIRDDGVTVVLVTHFMEEAERLCDRIMVIDHGCVAAIGTPTELIERVGGDQLLRFRPSEPIDDVDLTALEEVDSVEHRGSNVLVTGHGDVVHAVTSLLARRRIIAHEFRVDQTGLEDAYLEITSDHGGMGTYGERGAS